MPGSDGLQTLLQSAQVNGWRLQERNRRLNTGLDLSEQVQRHSRREGVRQVEVLKTVRDRKAVLPIAVVFNEAEDSPQHAPPLLVGNETSVLVDQALRRQLSRRSEERRVGEEGRSRWAPDH